jgi:tripartite-type tricarboxylate transporter receptor subunit TctC
MTRLPAAIVAICALFFGMGASAEAQYPEQPVRMLVGYSAGGGTDSLARVIAQALSERWGQPVIVENRVGAEGTIASELVAKAEPDGYTLVFSTQNHTITPHLQQLNFDPIKDFAPVSVAARSPSLFLVSESVEADDLKAFIALAKGQPGKLNFGSAGPKSNISLDMHNFMQQTGIEMTEIPYKGSGEILTAMLGDEVQASFSGSMAAGLSQLQSGTVRALGIGSTERVAQLPDVRTIAEAAGLPGFEASTWYGLFAPAGTPDEIVEKLHSDIVAVTSESKVADQLSKLGFIVIANSPEEFSAMLLKEMETWGALVKKLGIQ